MTVLGLDTAEFITVRIGRKNEDDFPTLHIGHVYFAVERPRDHRFLHDAATSWKQSDSFLQGDRVYGQFGADDWWLIPVRFPATSTDAVINMPILGSIISSSPEGTTMSYRADFTVSEIQRSSLLAGNAQLILTENLFTPDPDFRPQTFEGSLLPIPEPSGTVLLAAGLIALVWKQRFGSLRFTFVRFSNPKIRHLRFHHPATH